MSGRFPKICNRVEQRRVCFEQGGLLITTRQGRIYIGIVEDLIGGLHQGQDCVTGELRVETHTARSTLSPAESSPLDRNELVVSVQARDWLVGTLDGEFDVDAVTADPRHDTGNHPIAKR